VLLLQRASAPPLMKTRAQQQLQKNSFIYWTANNLIIRKTLRHAISAAFAHS
jgi:hypothetical protein